ncbi:hypothetical protein [Sorangium sp. So ce1000]|uniref:hypothetical protein n=1 Tax=Sorangium sp. So ce1000 TaxID=3133325 RepID=UPI003F62B48A
MRRDLARSSTISTYGASRNAASASLPGISGSAWLSIFWIRLRSASRAALHCGRPSVGPPPLARTTVVKP